MPNTHVPAAGEAMPAAEGMHIITGRFSRRLILAGLASLPAIAGATAALAVPATINPDAELFVLELKLNALKDRIDTLAETQGQLSEQAEEAAGLKPVHPSKWEKPSMPDDLKEMQSTYFRSVNFGAIDFDIEKEVARCPELVRAWNRAYAEEQASVKATWDEYRARLDEHHRLLGYDAQEAEFDDLVSEHWNLGQCIFEVPARTVAGMAVKVRTAESLGLMECAENDEALKSIAADIARLAQGGAA
ncbi:hypothetical protein FJ960_01835 [Mesorhizobium sp. B2-3-11]|uniref:hypothetical protein n=1 Tax=Mesorhizobium sp. B2-3-11 TaxID=2589953 RepID=UPI00112C1DC6|nr:hypothetical protein [Mesorhizobium sp. B2-3-11]TPM11509.1 hypothetical protein FJ960_01835 [Mesorhizobium sp. B2-3-11]